MFVIFSEINRKLVSTSKQRGRYYGHPTEWLNEFQVNTGTAATGGQSDPKILGLNNGNFVVAWVESTNGVIAEPPNGTDIIVKVFDAEGNVLVDAKRLNIARNFDDERDFDLAATHDGFAMAYLDDDISNTNQTSIFYERFDFEAVRLFGTGDSLEIANETVLADTLLEPQIAANLIAANDDTFVAFIDNVGTDLDVRGRIIDQAGAIGAEFNAGQNGTDRNALGDVVVLSNGNFVSVYEETDGSTVGIEFKIVNAAGTQVSNLNVTSGTASSDPAVASLAGGGFVVVYNQGNDVLARAYSNTGVSLFSEITVAGGSNNQNEPVVVGLPDGDFVVAWDDDTSNNLFARRFNADGTSDGFTFTVENVNITNIDISVTGDGRILFAWQDLAAGEISASIWDPRSSTIDPDDYNTELAHVLNSNVITTRTTSTTVLAASDTEDYFVFGQGGNDTIFSNGFGEYLGGAGSDTITAGNGTNGSGRAELLDGGAGIDTLDITTFGGTYGVNLATGVTTLNGVVIAEESFINFENVIAGAGNNEITGTSGANSIIAGAGNDTIDGDAGNDTLNGGDGDDMLVAGTGNDTLIGGNGNDTLDGTSGSPDNLSGGAGNDLMLLGGGAGDVINGGAGIDTLDYSPGFGVGPYFYNMNAGNGVSLSSLNAGFFFTTIVDDIENLITILGTEAVVLGNSLANVITTGSGNDTVDGGLGNDTINTGDGDDFVENANNGGFDVINGGAGNDTLVSSGESTIFGGSGNDSIFAGLGTPEQLDGGTGNDTLDTTLFDQIGASYSVNLATGVTSAPPETFLNFENIISGSTDDDHLGTIGANLMDGGGGDDRLRGFAGNDTLRGGDGDDTLAGGDGSDVVEGEAGVDRMFGQAGNDLMDGGLGDDSIEGNIGNDTLRGGDGNDLLRGADGNDNIDGGAGNDTAFGGNDNDVLRGFAGDDSLDGSGGNDFIDGGDGNDILVGETGADTLLGGEGNDSIRGGGGNDSMVGENGNDLMFGASGEDTLRGGGGNDTLEGDTQADDLRGEDGNDVLRGGDGFDMLTGGFGDDTLVGGNGNDVLIGGRGVDILRGNAQNDTFVFNSRLDTNFVNSDLIDGIEGIGVAGGDIIDVSGMDADITTAANDTFTFLGNVSTAVGVAFGPGALWVQDFGTQTRVFAELDNDGIIEIAIRINDGAGITAADYTAGDFIL